MMAWSLHCRRVHSFMVDEQINDIFDSVFFAMEPFSSLTYSLIYVVLT
jgi:hypothetical protein